MEITVRTAVQCATAKSNELNWNLYAESRLELCPTFTVWAVVLQNETYQSLIEIKIQIEKWRWTFAWHFDSQTLSAIKKTLNLRIELSSMARKSVTFRTLSPYTKHIQAAQLKIRCNQYNVKCRVESYSYVVIEYHFMIILLNRNFVNWALNGSSLIMQLQFPLKIHQTYGIIQSGLDELQDVWANIKINIKMLQKLNCVMRLLLKHIKPAKI